MDKFSYGSSCWSCCPTAGTPALSRGREQVVSSSCSTPRRWRGGGESARASPVWTTTSWVGRSATTTRRTYWVKCTESDTHTSTTSCACHTSSTHQHMTTTQQNCIPSYWRHANTSLLPPGSTSCLRNASSLFHISTDRRTTSHTTRPQLPVLFWPSPHRMPLWLFTHDITTHRQHPTVTSSHSI